MPVIIGPGLAGGAIGVLIPGVLPPLPGVGVTGGRGVIGVPVAVSPVVGLGPLPAVVPGVFTLEGMRCIESDDSLEHPSVHMSSVATAPNGCMSLVRRIQSITHRLPDP